jgi:hypothetical protein
MWRLSRKITLACSYRQVTNFADLQHVCGFLKDNLHARFRVKRLNDVAVLLYFDQDNPCMFVYEMSVSFEEWIHDGELELIQ